MCRNCRGTFIPSSIRHNRLEDLVCNFSDELQGGIDNNKLEDCHRFKGDRIIVKCFRGIHRKQVLHVQNDLKNINMTDLGFERKKFNLYKSNFMLVLQNVVVIE